MTIRPDAIRQDAIEQIRMLKEIEKGLVNKWEGTPENERNYIQSQIKDNFDEQMSLILFFDPPLEL